MRLSSSEVFIESHRVFAVSFFQNILAEEVGCLLVEDTVFLESFEGIVVQNIGPEIAVVACSITADDVVEVAVYDVMGRKVMQWAKETLKSDFYHITWDGITNSDACAPGIYLVRITLNGETVVRKVEKQ